MRVPYEYAIFNTTLLRSADDSGSNGTMWAYRYLNPRGGNLDSFGEDSSQGDK